MDVGAATLDFYGHLDDHCGHEGDMTPGSGGLVWLIPSSPRGVGGGRGAHESILMLGAGGRLHGGLSICLISEVVIGLFSC
jgi:hypothetical protein